MAVRKAMPAMAARMSGRTTAWTYPCNCGAALRARSVLAYNVSNAGATRVFAAVLERMHATYALQWWQRVFSISPTMPGRLPG